MEQLELEFVAADVRRRARLRDEDLLLAPEIAGRLLGRQRVVFGAAGSGARLEGTTIVVPRDHEDINFAVAHELAEIVLRDDVRFSGTHRERERAANSLAAAILAPPKMVRAAHAQFGEKLRRIARAFGLSQTGAALRLGEVEREERAVVTVNGHVLVRTQGVFPWAKLPIVEMARARRRSPGLAKLRLHGGIDEGRVSLRA